MRATFLKTLILAACCATPPLHAFKVLCILGSFPSLSDTFILNQITGLIDRGHDVSIYASGKEADGIYQPQVARYHLIERTFYQSLPQDFTVDLVICQYAYFYDTYKQLHNQYNL